MNTNYNEIGDLVTRCVNNEPGAFNQLYELSYHTLYGTAMSLMADPYESQDCVQEVFIIIFNTISQLKHPKLYYPWATTITRNYCLRYKSKQRDHVVEDIVFLADEHGEPIPDTAFIHASKEEFQLIAELVDELQPVYRDTFKYKNYMDLSVKEISEIMECPEGTIKSRLSSARRILKKKLQDHPDFNNKHLSLFPLPSLLLVKASKSITSNATSSSQVTTSTATLGSAIVPIACGGVLVLSVGGGVVSHLETTYKTTAIEHSTSDMVEYEDTIEWSGDMESPYVLSQEIVDDRIIILVADDHTGVDYTNIYGTLENGTKFYPVEYNSEVGSVEFDVPNQNFTLYIYDIEGNMIDVNFTL